MTTNILSELGLGIKSPLAVPDAPNYRPPCWPPQRDWPVILDAAGQVVSRWGDAIWRLDPWAGKPVTLNFGDGSAKKYAAAIDPANANLLRIVIGWWLYGPNGTRGYRGLKTRFDQMRRLFVLCTQEGILASELSQFPCVADRLPNILQASRAEEFLALLHELYERRNALGFTLLDRAGLARLAAGIPNHQKLQTPYIPPRIWHYQITRLRECLDDFLTHRDQIERCFRFCLAAYRHNSANLQGQTRPQSFYPFQWPSDGTNGKLTGRQYYGPFINTAHQFGTVEVFRRWLGVSDDEIRVQTLSRYLNLVSRAGLSYLLNFSLMRVEEAWGLCTDCLHIEHDPQFGDIHVLHGRTTKTMSDVEALWITSPSASVAVEAMRRVADLRAECGLFPSEGREPIDSSKHYLLDYMLEPWGTKFTKINRALRPSIPSYSQVLQSFDKLFDPEQLRITPEDFELARLVTPTLTNEFTVGKIWPLAWHQLRRTGAVNMQASGLVSDASLQFQLKHVTRAMSLYYGQNHSRVRMEEKAHTYYVRTMYEMLGRQLQQLTSNRFVSPHGEKRKSEIVRLISAADAKKVINLAKKGIVAYRPILLGICTSRIPCPYGGIDNIARCGGGDSPAEPKPCADVLYDPEQLDEVEVLEAVLDERLVTAKVDSPLRASLEAQKRSVENYRYVIRKT
ncbi:hypothetical protein ND449_17195 (plasmid) [Yersinia ruckeri]|uniref:hypothetical protein n=1 Tax=Yersinia TaxID=629 RepID=UPI002264957B|nr:hypothetical protein [Yersinia ruckeri]UZX63608.1 hypothetical protein ND449_17195 [Yersinia ruckeri]